jgi:hypothetical protein
MNKKIIILITLTLVLLPSIVLAEVPGVIKDFCEIHFNGQIANIGEPFNATDVIEQELPFRRIIDFLVTSSTAYLWYEHGGRGYHQHLVKFSTINPNEIQKSYIILKRVEYKSIIDLLNDSELLKESMEESEHL